MGINELLSIFNLIVTDPMRNDATQVLVMNFQRQSQSCSQLGDCFHGIENWVVVMSQEALWSTWYLKDYRNVNRVCEGKNETWKGAEGSFRDMKEEWAC